MSESMTPVAVFRPTQQMPVRLETEYSYYFNTDRNSVMHRPDGKKLAFVLNFYGTRDYYDKLYLNNEIDLGHTSLRFATVEEIRAFNMRVNPEGTLSSEIKDSVEQETEERFKAAIAKLRNEGIVSEDVEKKIVASILERDTSIASKSEINDSFTGNSPAAALRSLAVPMPGMVGSNATPNGS